MGNPSVSGPGIGKQDKRRAGRKSVIRFLYFTLNNCRGVTCEPIKVI